MGHLPRFLAPLDLRRSASLRAQPRPRRRGRPAAARCRDRGRSVRARSTSTSAASAARHAFLALPRTDLFVFDNGGAHHKDHNIKAWLVTILRYAGLPWQGTHILRKTCGTRIADNGGGVSAVASHLRHKSLQTASRYIDRRGGTSRALKALES